MPFKTGEEALAKANDSVYGLGAAIFTENLRRAHNMASKLKAGNIWVNCYGVVPHNAPFGGYKHSGNVREGGIYSMEFYSQLKNVYIDLK